MDFKHYPLACKSHGSFCFHMCSLTGSTMYPINAAFVADFHGEWLLSYARASFNHSISADLASHSRERPLYETFLITSISLRPLEAPFFSPRNRHLVIHGWDRLLLLIDPGFEPRTNRLNIYCSTK